jgi:hypothetical protein
MSLDKPHLHLLDKVSVDPIFIMGDARSGTTVLYDLLARTGCFNVVTVYHVLRYDELLHNHLEKRTDEARAGLSEEMKRKGIVDRKADGFPEGPDSPEEYGWLIDAWPKHIKPKTLPGFMEMCRKIQFVSDPGKPLLLKNPDDYNNFARIGRLLPQARMIFNHRNPVAVLNSWIYATRSIFYEKNAFAEMLSKHYENLWQTPSHLRLAQFLLSDKWSMAFRLGSSHVVNRIRYYLSHIGELPDSRCTHVSYERLCASPDPLIADVLAFLGLSAERPIDFGALIKPRPLRLLPSVEENLFKLDRKLAGYCRELDFPLPSEMAGAS